MSRGIPKNKSRRRVVADCRRAANSRAVQSGGRKKKIRVCEHCQQEFAAREMSDHTQALRDSGISIDRCGKFVNAAAN